MYDWSLLLSCVRKWHVVPLWHWNAAVLTLSRCTVDLPNASAVHWQVPVVHCRVIHRRPALKYTSPLLPMLCRVSLMVIHKLTHIWVSVLLLTWQILLSFSCVLYFFSAFTLLIGWHEGHPACKTWPSTNVTAKGLPVGPIPSLTW